MPVLPPEQPRTVDLKLTDPDLIELRSAELPDFEDLDPTDLSDPDLAGVLDPDQEVEL